MPSVQLQNLPRPTKEVEKNMERAIALLRAADYPAIKREFSSPLDVVGSCIRASFVAPPGKKFVVCDLNAIENRGLGWVAGCDSILQVFRDGRDPYVSFAVDLYNQPYEELIKDKLKRQNAKPAVLGAGYQLSGGEEVENADGDIIKTGLWGYAANMGIELTRDEAHQAVRVFRQKYTEVVQCWYDLERAALSSFRTHQPVECGRCVFDCIGKKLLRVILPSGRALHYIRPEIQKQSYITKDGQEREKDGMTYEGLDQVTRVWGRVRTHGGKWIENIVQALSRDLLAEALLRADAAGFEIVGHCHDEIISLVPDESPLGLAELRECMIEQPAWASDLPLDADGYEDKRYRKG